MLLSYFYKTKFTIDQGFGMEKDENRADLYLHSIVFCFESGSL